jgi:LexA-binding, inner membrane-associated putative hydrolase
VFLGHFAVAFAAKRAAPRVSLGTLFIACELVDLLWPAFVLLGLESVAIRPGDTAFTPLEFLSYPWTHSLLMCALWALAMGLLYFFAQKSAFAAGVVGAVVLSHWILDAIAHRPDLPLVPGGDARIGFGLWNSVAGTLLVEGAMFAAAVALYLRSTRASDRIGGAGFWVTLALLIASYGGAAFGPPPPDVQVVAWAGIAGGIVFGALGYWVDAHRVSIVESIQTR